MEILTTRRQVVDATNAARAAGKSVGLVPTMGFLHQGHLSLIETAAASCDVVLTTIFVNPLQFAPGEDLESYPRDIEGDTVGAEAAGSTWLFVPTTEEMYPQKMLTTVNVGQLSQAMEGASRRTHFGGVATVVAKLFSLVGPSRAFFGEKDFQQLAIIAKMASDLSLPIDVVGCPTVRESDGLAMSSRNKYLTETERSAAPVLQRALRSGAALIAAGETDSSIVKRHVADMIEAEPTGLLDYVEIADNKTLEVTPTCGVESRLFGAVKFGAARLIDNVGVEGADTAVGGSTRDEGTYTP